MEKVLSVVVKGSLQTYVLQITYSEMVVASISSKKNDGFARIVFYCDNFSRYPLRRAKHVECLASIVGSRRPRS